jgi:hypothetical protein
MNLAVLISDYQTYQFEKGALDYYRRCDGCDVDSLPFSISYHPPGDFGDITFSYTETGDTLFSGTIVWMGMGSITYPRDYHPVDRFGRLDTAAPAPVSVEYFLVDEPIIERSVFESKADSAWAALRDLDIVWDFSSDEYRVGIYLYPPSVGAFDPSVAKWIVYLYRNR